MAQIVMKRLRKEFGAFTAVQRSSVTIEDGEFFMLLGRSGCGKTTTLRMIAGLELPTAGEIFIYGAEVSQMPPSQRDIVFVFQMCALYPNMNVRKNVSYPLVGQGIKRDQVRAKVNEVAEILGITALLEKPVGGLSGGDRQRVALGRAIVRDPACFLMDDPLAALDAEFRENMALELRALHDRMRSTTVYVTNDQWEAMQMGDKIVVMRHGVVERFSCPQDIYGGPATTFAARFISSPTMNLLNFDGMVGNGSTQVTLSDAAIQIPPIISGANGVLTLDVRPEHIRLDDAAPLKGRILAAEYLGTTQIITLDTPHDPVKARTPSTQSATIGDTTGIAFDARSITLFDDTGHALISEANQKVLSHG